MEMTDTIVIVISSIAMLLYFFVAAQGAFYIFGFAKAMYNLPVPSFIELRKTVDPVVRSRFKTLYLSTITIMLIWVLVSDKSGGFWSYGLIFIAFLLLGTDLFLVVKASEPLNKTINGDISQTQESWNDLRNKWLKFILIRGSLSISGFVLLIAHLILQIFK